MRRGRCRIAFRPRSSAFYGVLTGSGGNLDKHSATGYGKKSYVAGFCKYHPPIIFILVLKLHINKKSIDNTMQSC